MAESSSKRLVNLASQWEKHRIPLVDHYRTLKDTAAGAVVTITFFCYINVIFMWCTLFECFNGFYAIGMCAVFTRLSVLTVIIFCSFLTTVYLSCSSWILALSCQGSDMHFLCSQLVSGEDKMNVQRSGSFPTLQKIFSNHCWNRGVTS